MQVIFAPTVLKKLNRIPPSDRTKVEKKIESLKISPLSGKPLRGEFSGLRSLRIWPLRVIYFFDSRLQTINIVNIDYRGSVYK